MDWKTVSQDFEHDGALRDIYISPASLDDWRAIYPFLRDYSGVEFFVDGEPQNLPLQIDEFFTAVSRPMLRFRVGRALVVFHFFVTDEIECDFDPREISSQTDLDALLVFIRELGDRTGKPVIVTPENLSDSPIISYEPKRKEFQHHALTN
jgi:hypothetical protein